MSYETNTVTCDKCGAIFDEPRHFAEMRATGLPTPKTASCPKCKAAEKAEAKVERVAEILKDGKVPRELWEYDPGLGNVELLQWAKAHTDHWIWIGGATGVGKTRALVRAFVELALDCPKDPPTIEWVFAADWMPKIGNTSGYGSGSKIAAELTRRAKLVDILFIDDIGMEEAPNASKGAFAEIVDFRYRTRGKRTWYTTNANGIELSDNIGDKRWLQIKRRILERGYVRTWDGEKWTVQTEMNTKAPALGPDSMWWNRW